MEVSAELLAAISSDICTLTGESHGVDLTDFPVVDEDCFVKHSLAGMQICHKIMHDCIQLNSSSSNECQEKV